MEGGFLPEPETRAASASSWDLQLADQRSLQPPRAAVQARTQPWGSAGSGGTAAPPGRFADGPPDNEGLLEAQGGCSRCPSLSFNSEWLRAFGVVLCNECKRSERLISKVSSDMRRTGPQCSWLPPAMQLTAPFQDQHSSITVICCRHEVRAGWQRLQAARPTSSCHVTRNRGPPPPPLRFLTNPPAGPPHPGSPPGQQLCLRASQAARPDPAPPAPGGCATSQSTAKQQYSVCDADLSRLGSLRKANPHKKDWQAMHLYMESQVRAMGSLPPGGLINPWRLPAVVCRRLCRLFPAGMQPQDKALHLHLQLLAGKRPAACPGWLNCVGVQVCSHTFQRPAQRVPPGCPAQVARLAHDKHGGAEGLQQHQQARLDKQLEGRLKARLRAARAHGCRAERRAAVAASYVCSCRYMYLRAAAWPYIARWGAACMAVSPLAAQRGHQAQSPPSSARASPS